MDHTYFKFYVYVYLDENLVPYYVGKGRGRRYKSPHRVLVPTDPNKIVIVYSEISEVWAFALERRLIQWYGRKDKNTGILENRSDGGDGPSGQDHRGSKNPMFGRKHTAQSKLRISESCKGYVPANKGKICGPYSGDRRAKISAGQIGRKHSPETIEKIRLARKKYWAKTK